MEHSSVILIVDDNPEFIHMTGTLLTRNGYEVRVADSGRQALSLLDREIPDLILLDIRMPEMDGLAVCRQIRENSRCEDTAILFITGEQDRASLEEGFRLGAQDYILKPCQPSELLARIRTHLQIINQTRELKAAYREMDQFCHSVSHDLKSPIQVMLQLLELLSAILKESANPLPEDADEVMERLFHKCSQAEAMIMRLLDFSRMTQLPCRPVPVDPEKIIRNAYNDLVLLEEGRIIHLTIEKLPSVCGDPVLLSQLFTNILSNSLKFTRNKPEAEIRVTSQQKGGQTAITFTDNGAGFDMAYADRLFSVFERLHSSTEFEGTGVGLTIVKRIMLRHGGDVSIHSVPDEGTSLTLYFP